MIAGMSPWLSMWGQPRSTVRAIVLNRPTYGVYYLAAIYALQSFFFYENWYSLGLKTNHYLLFALGVILSPLVGCAWLYFTGWILHFTGHWLKGNASALYLRTAIAWSKIPTCITLLMWLILIFMNPDFVFIQDAGGPYSLFINLILLIVSTWSFILLIQSVREIQHFSLGKAIGNVVLAWFVSSFIVLLASLIIRYIYLFL